MATLNLGQVSGLWIGTTSPTNTSLIWYDSTPAVRCHKVYNPDTSAWEVLNKDAIVAITYSELQTIAQNPGMAQGSWYKITDRGNALALAITSTKIQYVDVNGNFIIDDLAASSAYLVSSTNLFIDDLQGVTDANGNLKFDFVDTPHDGSTDNDYLFGKKYRNNIWSLAKYKLSLLVSAVVGNSITWNRGFFFNFNSALSAKMDVSGGVPSKTTYDTDMATMTQSIQNVAAQNQQILTTAEAYTDAAVEDDQIYDKRMPTTPANMPYDIVSGDTLEDIVSKTQTNISNVKKATGVHLTQGFTPSVNEADINNNDTVESAFGKIQYWRNDRHNQKFAAAWTPADSTQSIADVTASDNYENAFAKLQGRFNHLGITYPAGIRPLQDAATDYDANIKSGLNVSPGGYMPNPPSDPNKVAFSAEYRGNRRAAFIADAYFPRVLLNSMMIKPKVVDLLQEGSNTYYADRYDGMIIAKNSPGSNNGGIILPQNPIDGMVVRVYNAHSNSVLAYSDPDVNTPTRGMDIGWSTIQQKELYFIYDTIPAYTIRTYIFCADYKTGLYTNGIWIRMITANPTTSN